VASLSAYGRENANGAGSGTYDFTSLMGCAKKVLLKKLPSKLKDIIRLETSETVINLWKVITFYVL
jgi:hypothetical protein